MKTIDKLKTDIVDIFSSIQGEGLYVGERHLFVRFKDCNLKCINCDEVNSDACVMTIDDVIKNIQIIEKNNGHHSYVTLTGGEPLHYIDFMFTLCEILNNKGYKIFLETNGTLYEELKKVIHLIAVTSMDIKLKSVWGINDCYILHKEFLHILKGSIHYIKIIVSEKINIDEFINYVNLICDVNYAIPLILQPLKTSNTRYNNELISLLCELQRIALKRLSHVRVIPQMHKILHIS